MDFLNKEITVIGLGKSGIAAANLLSEIGSIVTVTDIRGEEDLEENIKRLNKGIALRLSGHSEEDILGADLVVVSPGVDMRIPVLEKARGAGVHIISEVELAYLFAESPIIAVTGTNGKTTTTSIIADILLEGGKEIALGGNIGFPLSERVSEWRGKDFIVAEISSFQLEGIERFKPYIGVILNITPDHLDRHIDFDEYINLKKRIYMNQTEEDYLVLNYDDPITYGLSSEGKAKKLLFSTVEDVEEGVFIKGGEMIIRLNGTEQKISFISDLWVDTIRNIDNIIAATAVCAVCGIDIDAILRVISRFKGLEHRIEFVREVEGIKFINDSKATNVGAAIRAIQIFDDPILLIAGGRDKESNYSLLKDVIEKKVKRLILFGEAKDKIKSALNDLKELIVEVDSLKDAIYTAFSMGLPGDVVLFSPACASFDMFRDYKDRGNSFKEIVRCL
ncbi:MAG: UDP-N-acetylmuramoyl-L-alanine--D-glutamate ligase [Nitrospinae bacterium]|nr:UDP-N-acetylmuramoyl-L-alanine--D-glutamate ligase [Nitrospinota bacterium]